MDTVKDKILNLNIMLIIFNNSVRTEKKTLQYYTISA